MAEQHIAKWNKVWQKKGTKTPLENKITLKDKESISDYEQVLKPKVEPKKEAYSYTKPKTENEKGAF